MAPRHPDEADIKMGHNAGCENRARKKRKKGEQKATHAHTDGDVLLALRHGGGFSLVLELGKGGKK